MHFKKLKAGEYKSSCGYKIERVGKDNWIVLAPKQIAPARCKTLKQAKQWCRRHADRTAEEQVQARRAQFYLIHGAA